MPFLPPDQQRQSTEGIKHQGDTSYKTTGEATSKQWATTPKKSYITCTYTTDNIDDSSMHAQFCLCQTDRRLRRLQTLNQ